MCLCVCSFIFCIALRALDILSDDVLVELSSAYRRMVSHPAPPHPKPQTSQCASSFQ